MDKLKNYLLWPLLAITLALSIYLSLVFIIYQILSNSSFIQEEPLWQFITNDIPYQHSDKRKQKEIQEIVDKLPIELLPDQYNKIKILVLTSEDVNAFAAPGGRIIITTGLLNQGLSQEAIIFVIGHEMAHLQRKDHIYEFAKMVAAKIYRYITGSELVQELLLLADNSKLNKTEFLADEYSVNLLDYYYNSALGAEEFFEYLINSNNYAQSGSHPSAKDRLQKIHSYTR